MADLGSTSYNEVDASNSASPPDGWPEGMAPSNVNNSARANMGAEKRFWDRINAVFTTAGTTTAYTLTYTQAAAAYYDGEIFAFVINATCGATPTLNINGLGARSLRKWSGSAYVALAAGDLAANQFVMARYNLAATSFDLSTATIVFPTATTAAQTAGVDASTATAGVFVNGPNTGSIGAAGQKWLITAGINYANTSGGNMTGTIRIWDGTTSAVIGTTALQSGFTNTVTLSTIQTFSAATTWTAQATDNVGGNLGKQNSAGGCWITAVRLS